jgi:hypothetical protein
LLVKFGNIFGTLVWELGIFVPHRQNKTPVPNSSTRDNLSFWFQVEYQIAPNPCFGLRFWVMNPCNLELSAQNS